MKVGIIGAGAMGSLIGFYLSQHAEVWLLDPWQAHVEAINAGGLCRELGAVEETRYPQATSDPSAIGSCDAVLVLVKAHQTAWAAQQARALLKPDSQQFDKVTRPALSPSAPRLLSPSKGRVNSAEGWQGGKVQHDQGTTLSPPHPVTLSQ